MELREFLQCLELQAKSKSEFVLLELLGFEGLMVIYDLNLVYREALLRRS